MSSIGSSHRISRAWLVAAAVLVAACSSGSDSDDSDDSLASAAESGSVGLSIETADTVASAMVETTVPGATTAPTTSDSIPDGPENDPVPSTIVIDDDRLSLVWGVTQPDANSDLDPALAIDFGTYAVLAQVTEYLVATDVAGRPIPSLATGWTPNDDATEWTFELRPDVQFHDGATFTADDAVASLERAIDFGAPGLDVVATGGIVATDDATVVITTTGPTLDLPIRVSDAAPQTAILAAGDAPSGGLLNGTGPFRLESYDPFDGAVFSANDDWWAGTPSVGRLEFVFFDTLGRSTDSLRARAIDGIAQLPALEADRLRDDPDITIGTTPANNHRQIWMRTDEGPFADVRVRQAFALSFDRDAVTDTLFGGTARVGNDHPISAADPGFDPAIAQRTKDDAAAQALLSDAGFPDGIDVTLHVGDLQEIPELAGLIAEQAASAGFRITVDVQSNSTFYTDSWCPGFGSDRCDGDSFGIVDYGHRPIPNQYLGLPLATGGEWNASNHADPEFDALFDRFENATTDADRNAVTSEIQRYVHDQVPVVIPYFFDTVHAHRADLGLVTSTALGQPLLAFAQQT